MSQPTHAAAPHAASTLLAVLNAELVAGRELLRVAGAQTEALVRNDVCQFERLEAQARSTMARQELIEAQRKDLVRRLARDLRVPSGDSGGEVPLRTLASFLSGPEARQLLRVRQKLLAVEQEIRGIVARNQTLLQNARDVIRLSLDLLAQMAMAPAKYGANADALAAPTFYIDRRA